MSSPVSRRITGRAGAAADCDDRRPGEVVVVGDHGVVIGTGGEDGGQVAWADVAGQLRAGEKPGLDRHGRSCRPGERQPELPA
jgi:hypothetical protein